MKAPQDRILGWFAENARDLPWRRPGTTPWAVLVSEVMLQQTPVARVLPAYERWVARWPSPASLAAAPAGDAVRAWGRLGYPRRALRLHAAAVVITEDHGGQVPGEYHALLRLPGVGEYTASAVAAFAFGERHAVLDTNVRRVLARLYSGRERPSPSPTAVERRLAEELIPDVAPEVWAVAVMELGALICTARRPACTQCPASSECSWLRAGKPAYDGPVWRGQNYQGSDRQARGAVLAALRGAQDPVTQARLDLDWPDAAQRKRALASLIKDGLVEKVGRRYALPGSSRQRPSVRQTVAESPVSPTTSTGGASGIGLR